jgi:hypothetical protein
MDNIIILDLETVRSADDCRHCLDPKSKHLQIDNRFLCFFGEYDPIGWDNKAALGLSIGCYWDYDDQRIHWFDPGTLERTVEHLVARQTLLVSFNGLGFDFPLMDAVLRTSVALKSMEDLCDEFKTLYLESYDILAEIWKIDPINKFARGVNSLDAIAQRNGLGPKLSNGAQAPRDWAAGRYADVLNYCQDDVLKTKALFEMVMDGQPIRRNVSEPMDALMLRDPFPAYYGIADKEKS